MSSGAAPVSRDVSTCAVELLQLGWEAFRSQDPGPLSAAERLMRDLYRGQALEQGSLPGTVRSLLEILATIRAMLDEQVPFTDRAMREINSLFDKGIELLECLRDALVTENRVLVRHIIGSGIQFAQLAKDYAMAHQQRVLEGVCHPRASSVYLEMLEQLKGLEGHTREIAQQLALRHVSPSRQD
jgi:hypothetical protein